MALEKLKDSLLEEAKAESRKILDAASETARKIQNDELSALSSMKSDNEKEIQKWLDTKRRERLAWARLESKRMIAESKEDAVSASLESFLEILEQMKKSPEYKKFLKDSVDRAVSELGDGSIIHLLKGDKENISKMKNVSIVEDLNGLGGAIVESSDGKVIVDLSLETLYELRKDDLRKQISEKLFG
jgi:vacuolar-type H+-ATPase subunit E/Vma4